MTRTLWRTLAACGLFSWAAVWNAGPATARCQIESASGNLETYVDDWEATIPGKDDANIYDSPTAGELAAFKNGFEAARNGNLGAAACHLAAVNYQVIAFTDTSDPNGPSVGYVVLREITPVHAWGLYVLREPATSVSKFVVEVPHPRADLHTERLGVLAQRSGKARYLFIAGAHRWANGEFDHAACVANPACADVAHQPASMFHAMHMHTVGIIGTSSRVLQLHGFGDGHADLTSNWGNHAGQLGDVVISNGVKGGDTCLYFACYPNKMARDIATRLDKPTRFHGGFSVCLFRGPDGCSSLGAQNNVQGRYLRGPNQSYTGQNTDFDPLDDRGKFIHAEASFEVRNNLITRFLLAARTAAVMRT